MPDATIIGTRRATAPVPPVPEGSVAELIDALAVAWIMFRVYHDPRPQDAFRRAVAILARPSRFPWTVEIHSGGFRSEGQPVPTRRQAAPALARSAFARGIAVLGFSAPPTPDDLLHLFEVVSMQQDPGTPVLGPVEALAAAGAEHLIVGEHGRLIDTPGDLAPAEELVPGEPGATEARPLDSSRRYLHEYRVLYDRLQAGDFQGLQELVHGFTDSFFALPREEQKRLFEQFLTRHEEEPFRLLLDQFSQDDLAELAALLSPGTHPLLVEYARIAAEQEGQGAGATEKLPAEQLLSDRISHLLRSGRAALRRQVGDVLRSQIPGPQGNFAAGVTATASLFTLTDDAGFGRLARAVAAKAAAAASDGDLARAASWGRVLLAAAPTRDRKETVRREMEAALRPDILDQFLPAVAGLAEPPPAMVDLVALFALEQAVESLAVETDKGRRKALASLLTAAARLRPGPLIRRLGDPRWHLVRNLVDILAHSGRLEAASGLRAACRHSDHRVRREALRALPLLDRQQGAAAALEALTDPEATIRLQALGLLRTASGREVDSGLAAFVESRPPLEERLAAVDVLAARRTAAARAALRRLARRRLRASAAARQTRRAARQALNGGAR